MNEQEQTPQKPVKPGNFTKNDPRINRKGRPKSFDALQALAKEVAHEEATDRDRKPIIINGKKVTYTEVILRSWALSNDFRKQQAFMEIAYGKTPNVTRVTGADGEPLVSFAEIIAALQRVQSETEAVDAEIIENPVQLENKNRALVKIGDGTFTPD